MSLFQECEPGFCPQCGSILPPLGSIGGVTCYTCKQNFGPEVFGNMEEHYVIHFKSVKSYTTAASSKSASKVENDEDADGPIVERRCPKCNNDKMSYATLQLRSADEGQTVFYTCTKCRYSRACYKEKCLKRTKHPLSNRWQKIRQVTALNFGLPSEYPLWISFFSHKIAPQRANPPQQTMATASWVINENGDKLNMFKFKETENS